VPRIATVALLTNHAHVLLCVARDPEMRLRDIADCVGVTERAAHRIVCELEHAGYLTRRREGRRSVYSVHADRELPHALEAGARVRDLLDAVSPRAAV
jgi:DNA-binding IclR family transcriptional regulator